MKHKYDLTRFTRQDITEDDKGAAIVAVPLLEIRQWYGSVEASVKLTEDQLETALARLRKKG